MAYTGDNPVVVVPQPREQPNYFRRIPTRRGASDLPTVGTQRGYYNPVTRETMTEHQYLRRYRRGLSYRVKAPDGTTRTVTPPTTAEMENQQYYQQEYRRSVQRQYQLGAQESGISYSQYRALQQEREYYGFLNNQLDREGRYEEARMVRRPGGPWATNLEAMGLRPAGATWDVGTSDQVPAFNLWKAGGRVA